jgi:hypothetical protein
MLRDAPLLARRVRGITPLVAYFEVGSDEELEAIKPHGGTIETTAGLRLRPRLWTIAGLLPLGLLLEPSARH